MSLSAHLHLNPMLFKVGGDSFTREKVLADKVEVLLKQPWTVAGSAKRGGLGAYFQYPKGPL